MAIEAGDVTDEQIERAIVNAMLEGRGAVAETLTAMLARRRRERAGNVVDIDAKKRRT